MVTLPFLVCARVKPNLDHPALNIPDTVTQIIYDTVYTYDTVYEYVEIQETIFVYDTVTVFQMPVLGYPDTLLFIPETNTAIPLKKARKTNALPASKADSTVKYRKKNRHPDRWFSLDDETGVNPVPFGYGVKKNNAFGLQGDAFIPIEQISGSTASLTDSINTYYRPELSWRQQLLFYHTFGRFNASAAVGLSQVNHSLEVPETRMSIENSLVWNHFRREEFVNDTTWILDMDALLQGDTVWIPFVETLTTYIDDSVQQETTDTLFITHRVRRSSQLQFLEIPVQFGYTFIDHDRWKASASAGFTGLLLLKSNGPMYDPETGFIREAGSTSLNQWHAKVSLLLNGSFELTPYTTIYLSMGYATSITSYINGTAYSMRYNELSAGLGIRFLMFKKY